jgi:hypothetical protein
LSHHSGVERAQPEREFEHRRLPFGKAGLENSEEALGAFRLGNEQTSDIVLDSMNAFHAEAVSADHFGWREDGMKVDFFHLRCARHRPGRRFFRSGEDDGRV